VRGFVENVPLFLPAFLVAVVAAVVLTPTVAPMLASRRRTTFLLILSIGLIGTATLTPLQSALEGLVTYPGTCDLRRFGLSDLIFGGQRLNDARLNVLLFIPLGVAIGLLHPLRRKLVLFAIAALSPIVIELMQLLAVKLGRGCQLADVVDNLIGLAIGFLLGVVGSRMLRDTDR
jgi:glycopeptide antibiotics resistance protein